jgi:hypothetical protein
VGPELEFLRGESRRTGKQITGSPRLYPQCEQAFDFWLELNDERKRTSMGVESIGILETEAKLRAKGVPSAHHDRLMRQVRVLEAVYQSWKNEQRAANKEAEERR